MNTNNPIKKNSDSKASANELASASPRTGNRIPVNVREDSFLLGMAMGRFDMKRFLSVGGAAPTPPSGRRKGFALVAALMMMLLLGVLALGLLSLSSISLRAGSRSVAMEMARANARMALMVALGELQEHAGPDQRVTASSSILSDPGLDTDPAILHPHWTGIWDSWKANDANPSGGDQPSQHATLGSSGTGMHPNYSPGKSTHFRAWLASVPDEMGSDIDAVRDLSWNAEIMPGKDDQAVKLVAEGSLGDAGNVADHVSVGLLDVNPGGSNRRGRFGWWVGDQSVKASIMADTYDSDQLTAADRIYRQQSPGSTGTTRADGLENVPVAGFTDPPSLNTLNLFEGADRPSERGFHDITLSTFGVLADVREGGLKRDLSILLEQPIDINDTSDEYMLYRFSTGTQERVPIQDLSAYYQLYQDDPSWSDGRRGGVKYASGSLGNAIQVEAPDFGRPDDRDNTLREYTALYRNPVPVKIQVVLGVTAVDINSVTLEDFSQADLIKEDPQDTHLLAVGVMPVVTLWNPFNVPIVMGGTEARSQVLSMGAPPVNFTWAVERTASNFTHRDGPTNFGYYLSGNSSDRGGADPGGDYSRILSMRIGKDEPIVFEPGEVKIFTIKSSASNNTSVFSVTDGATLGSRLQEMVNGYDPNGFFLCAKASAPGQSLDRGPMDWGPGGSKNSVKGRILAYSIDGIGKLIGVRPEDEVTCTIDTEKFTTNDRQGTNAAAANEVAGGAFQFSMMDNDNFSPPKRGGASDPGLTESDHIRNYHFLSRFGGNGSNRSDNNVAFNEKLGRLGFPAKTAPIGGNESLSVSEIIAASGQGEVQPVAIFTLRAGCEAHESATNGSEAGRSAISTRPFLHSGSIVPQFLDSNNYEDLYNYGWDWSVERINSVDQVIQLEPGTKRTFFGGGYTSEKGTTYVVQQEVPVVPPISIASLSHAQLGGFSLASRPYVGEADEYFNSYLWPKGNWQQDDWSETRCPDESGDGYRRTTATGMGGMYPTVMQAIGNSYAHPNLAPDKAFELISRTYDNDVGGEERIFADHSYLANKALWDEFYFSSLTPQPASAEIFGGAKTLAAVAQDFFLADQPLANRRMTAYLNPDSGGLNNLMAEKDDFTDGMADKLAQHLLVRGAFNINSTSVGAWRVLLSSLRGKPIQYLEKNAGSPTEVTPTGTPVGFGMLPGGAPTQTNDATNPNAPDQWVGWRELSDTEIDELANAIVEQIKLRGPFLSLSEFINRRLDGSNPELALKGALQAALDDPSVSINAPFRANDRLMDGEPGLSTANFDFPEAAQGPIAYGSSAYVDQADVLRNLAGQLTPRGDTFVIRAYGDALDANNDVLARAWCEATVQRVPEYVDSVDEDHLKQSNLTSESNKIFGRKFKVVSFRWLSQDEI